MDELAKALLDLDWSDMDDFAQHVRLIATDDDGQPNDERFIAQALVKWAHDNRAT